MLYKDIFKVAFCVAKECFGVYPEYFTDFHYREDFLVCPFVRFYFFTPTNKEGVVSFLVLWNSFNKFLIS